MLCWACRANFVKYGGICNEASKSGLSVDPGPALQSALDAGIRRGARPQRPPGPGHPGIENLFYRYGGQLRLRQPQRQRGSVRRDPSVARSPGPEAAAADPDRGSRRGLLSERSPLQGNPQHRLKLEQPHPHRRREDRHLQPPGLRLRPPGPGRPGLGGPVYLHRAGLGRRNALRRRGVLLRLHLQPVRHRRRPDLSAAHPGNPRRGQRLSVLGPGRAPHSGPQHPKLRPAVSGPAGQGLSIHLRSGLASGGIRHAPCPGSGPGSAGSAPGGELGPAGH